MLSLHMILVMVTTAGAIVAIFGLIGPIGTDEVFPPLQRWAYFALYFFPGWPICYSLNVVVLYFVRSRSPLEVVLALALAGLFGAVPCTTIMYTFETLIQVHHSATAELLRLFVVVATVAVASNVLFLYVVYQRLKQERGNIGGPAASTVRGTNGAGAPVADPPLDQSNGVPSAESSANGAQHPADVDRSNGTSPQVPFLELLPDTVGRDLIYIKSEDHYIDAFTVVGSSLIKMRFADAVAELGDELGTQVHRCYWVTYRHMKELVKRDRKFVLLLTGNYEVPVSSTYRASVRMAMKQSGDPVSSSNDT